MNQEEAQDRINELLSDIDLLEGQLEETKEAHDEEMEELKALLQECYGLSQEHGETATRGSYIEHQMRLGKTMDKVKAALEKKNVLRSPD